MTEPLLILASASPQRKILLKSLGLHFEVVPSGVREETCPERDPGKRALCLASLKARDVAARHPKAWVLGCDTLVVASDGTLLEKPADEEDARRMIRRQSGAQSLVHSGLALRSPRGEGLAAEFIPQLTDLCTSRVSFHKMSNARIDWWIGTGLWQSRSGAFQIDGPGQLMIEWLEGDWSGVVGLSLFAFGQLCRKAGAPFLL